MTEKDHAEPKEERKAWTKPELRRFKLTEEEVSALRASDDPMALLLKLKPEIVARNGPAR